MVMIDNFVYACGGLDGNNILDSCERFDLMTETWQMDVPNLNEAKFSMTMMKLDKTWIYSFGGATNNYNDPSQDLELERLNTQYKGKLIPVERFKDSDKLITQT